ncbi:MAG TPA: methyl-accepting chemotaxis protein, partial [Candidatus Angelobacter sp.]|nr:methyl-accepting chemotaxis protein [Candidatus Angelobacter sp.]
GGEIVESVRSETDEVAKMVAHIGNSLIEHVQASSLILEYVSHVEQSSLGTKDAARGTLMASQQIRDASDELSRRLEGFRL